MRYTFLGALALLTVATVSPAQVHDGVRPEIRPFVGVYVPTGGLRHDFERAAMFGAQGALEMSDYFHVLGSVAWTDGRAKFGGLADRDAAIWLYDVGFELNLLAELGNSGWLFRPLAGLGAGGRTYDYDAAGVSTSSKFAGYGALGVELEKGIIALRFEARDWVTRVDSPRTGVTRTRNDLGFMFGLAYHLR